ncbi:hypothetical protein GUJ93_ZPchr0003g18323 [Zizania palustris]|uniref:Uncharacterized protein n=1 Tax=Zizania palustris TaxID=103762 RepID=A0A8J5VL43_ZIZPA|nr:hypothetical protein GUJ93_ZPchr0003g18323 [Zizania palustris]
MDERLTAGPAALMPRDKAKLNLAGRGRRRKVDQDIVSFASQQSEVAAGRAQQPPTACVRAMPASAWAPRARARAGHVRVAHAHGRATARMHVVPDRSTELARRPAAASPESVTVS